MIKHILEIFFEKKSVIIFRARNLFVSQSPPVTFFLFLLNRSSFSRTVRRLPPAECAPDMGCFPNLVADFRPKLLACTTCMQIWNCIERTANMKGLAQNPYALCGCSSGPCGGCNASRLHMFLKRTDIGYRVHVVLIRFSARAPLVFVSRDTDIEIERKLNQLCLL